MNKKRIYIISSTLLLIGLFAGVVQYVGMFDALYAAAVNPGHSWSQMECSDVFCVDTINGRVGIGISSPSNKLHISGNLKITENIVDSLDNIIYNSETHKIETDRLPFDKGDIVSDYATNSFSSSYYNIANLNSANIKSGISYGRDEVGSFVPSVSCTQHSAIVYCWDGVYPGSGTVECGPNSVLTAPINWWQANERVQMSYFYISGLVAGTCTDPSCNKLYYDFGSAYSAGRAGFSWWCCDVQ